MRLVFFAVIFGACTPAGAGPNKVQGDVLYMTHYIGTPDGMGIIHPQLCVDAEGWHPDCCPDGWTDAGTRLEGAVHAIVCVR